MAGLPHVSNGVANFEVPRLSNVVVSHPDSPGAYTTRNEVLISSFTQGFLEQVVNSGESGYVPDEAQQAASGKLNSSRF